MNKEELLRLADAIRQLEAAAQAKGYAVDIEFDTIIELVDADTSSHFGKEYMPGTITQVHEVREVVRVHIFQVEESGDWGAMPENISLCFLGPTFQQIGDFIKILLGLSLENRSM